MHSLRVGGTPPPPFFSTITPPSSPLPPPRSHSLSNLTYRCFTSPLPPPHSHHISATGLQFRFALKPTQTAGGQTVDKVSTEGSNSTKMAVDPDRRTTHQKLAFLRASHHVLFSGSSRFAPICKSCAALTLTNCELALPLGCE